MNVLKGLEPKEFFHYFEEISNIPRGSYHEEAISKFVSIPLAAIIPPSLLHISPIRLRFALSSAYSRNLHHFSAAVKFSMCSLLSLYFGSSTNTIVILPDSARPSSVLILYTDTPLSLFLS